MTLKNGTADNIWEIFFNFEENQEKAKLTALEIIKKYLGGSWNEPHVNDFIFEKLSGGFTNLVFKCSSSSNSPVVLRIEFPKSPEERAKEQSIIKVMSDAKLAPNILTIFPEGRIEEYVNSRIISEEERADPKYAFELGMKVAEMHQLRYDGPKRNQYFETTRGFFDRIVQLGTTTFQVKPRLSFQNFPSEVTIEMLAEELKFLEKYSNRFANPISLIHNDLFAPNILIQKEIETNTGHAEKGIMLIDYEFSMHGHRAADFVSYCIDFARDPTRKVAENLNNNHVAFCHVYLKRTYENALSIMALQELKLTGDLENDTKSVLTEAQGHMVLTHMFWGMWNLICHLEGNSQLQYEKFYSNRFAAYYSMKQLL